MRARILTIVNVIHFMLLVQSSSNDLRRKLKCDSYDWHPNAKEGYEDVDIFKPSDSHLKAESVEASQPVLEDAVRYVKSHVNSTIAELATLDPTYSNCTWLKTQLIDRAGLGHTFACWANYLKMSIENGLTLHYPFYSSDHEVCNLNDTTHFFGLHSAFYWGREPPQDAVVIDVGSQRKGDCDSKRLAIAMQNYTSINGSFSCAKGHVVFKCFNHEVDFQTRFVKSFDGVQLPVRAAFSASFKRHGPNHRHPLVDAAKKNNELVIVAHMRRGDILESRKIDKDHRLVSFGVYQSMFRELLKARMFYALNSTSSLQPVHFFILCEGAPDKDHVVEYEVQDMHKTYKVNTTAIIIDVCNSTSACAVDVLWDAPFLTSFTTMCESDVLVTSTSGFSWVAAAFCEPPLTLGIKFSADYIGIKNVVHVKPLGPLWKWDSKVQLDDLKSLWGDMMTTFKSLSHVRQQLQ